MMTPLPDAPLARIPTVAGMTFLRTTLTCCWIALRSSMFSGAGFSSAAMEGFFGGALSSAAVCPARSPASARAKKASNGCRRAGGDRGLGRLTENLPGKLRVGMTEGQYIVAVGPNRGQQIL